MEGSGFDIPHPCNATESFIPEEEVLQKVAGYFAAWRANKIVALEPLDHTEEKSKLHIYWLLAKTHATIYAMVRLTMKAIFIMLLRSHWLMFLYQTKTTIVRRRKKMLMQREIGLK